MLLVVLKNKMREGAKGRKRERLFPFLGD